MTQFIDRRRNPKDRSLGNRRRFIRRVQGAVKEAVDSAVRKRGIADVDRGDSVSIPAKGIKEPTFHHAREGGHREHVLPGNKNFRPGDRIDKPQGAGGGAGKGGAPEGEAEDDFLFVLSRDEFLDVFFEDLKLPDMVKRSLKRVEAVRPRRSGISVTGTPANLSVGRSMRNAIGRRFALGRPRNEEIQRLRDRIGDLASPGVPEQRDAGEMVGLKRQLDDLLKRRQLVPFLDPLDLRYRYYEMRPEPTAHAVMFCLMDVSASMGEREKDLAKRFFALLHLFLKRCYEKVELVFIRHTHEAKEVDEDTFFHSKESGGTVVSTSLAEMQRLIAARYPPAEWNIYAAQASDGENYPGDSDKCVNILDADLLRICQYFAYVEIIEPDEALILKSPDSGTELWQSYLRVAKEWPNFALKRVAAPADIYPVFRELFSAQSERRDG